MKSIETSKNLDKAKGAVDKGKKMNEEMKIGDLRKINKDEISEASLSNKEKSSSLDGNKISTNEWVNFDVKSGNGY
jgi:hypothetical protein